MWRPDPETGNPFLNQISYLKNAKIGVYLCITFEVCLFLTLLLSIYYLVRHLKAVYLLRNICYLDEIYAPRHDDIAKTRNGQREFTLADLLAKERL